MIFNIHFYRFFSCTVIPSVIIKTSWSLLKLQPYVSSILGNRRFSYFTVRYILESDNQLEKAVMRWLEVTGKNSGTELFSVRWPVETSMDWGICKYLERGKEGNPIKLENLDNLSLHMCLNVFVCLHTYIEFISTLDLWHILFPHFVMSFLSIFKYCSST